MFDLMHPEKQRLLFTGRKDLLDILSKGKNVALLGPKGIGKTLLLKQYISANLKEKDFSYIDLTRASITPESFAVEFIGNICFWKFSKKHEEYDSFFNTDKLLSLKLGTKSLASLKVVQNVLEKIKPNQKLLIESALQFAEDFAKEDNTKLTIILDEFQELLAMNNYSQLSDILKLFFESTNKHKNVHYILSSSSVNSLTKALKGRIDLHEVQPFGVTETKELVKKVDSKISEKDAELILNNTNGSPLLIKAISETFTETKDVKNALLTELVLKNSETYSHLSQLFNSSLNSARGASLLKAILKVLSQNPNLRLSDVARKIYRSSPVTKSLLERLVEVDMVVKNGNTYKITDPVLERWCRFMFANIEFDKTPSIDELKRLGGVLE